MNYRNKYLYIILGVLCCFALLISIAFAALSATKTINFGTGSKGSHTWNIHLASDYTTVNVPNNNNPVQIWPDEYGTSSTGRYCSQAITYQGNSFSISEVSLSKPGDKCVWNIPIKNEGTIDAYLSEILFVPPTTLNGSVTCTNQTINNVNYGLICGEITLTAYQCTNISIDASYSQMSCTSYQGIDHHYGNWIIDKNGGYGILVLEAKYNSNSVNTNVYNISTTVQLQFSQH